MTSSFTLFVVQVGTRQEHSRDFLPAFLGRVRRKSRRWAAVWPLFGRLARFGKRRFGRWIEYSSVFRLDCTAISQLNPPIIAPFAL